MANKVIGDYSAAITIDGTTHFLLIQPGNSSTAYKKISRNILLAITGAPVGDTDSQALTNKTLGNTNTITLKDTLFTLQDDGDATKQVRFQLSGITTGNTRTLTVPNASVTLASLTGTEALTNKTLTAPVITNGSITGTTITTDAIVGQSASTNGTVYGLAITSGTIAAAGIATSAVTTAKIASSAVDNTKVATGFSIQTVNVLSTAVATGTTVIPLDDTIPQNTEGDQYMTLAITPKSATNILVITATVFLSNSANSHLVAALFQDATASALAATAMYQLTPSGAMVMVFTHTMAAGTTSSTTFKIRAGGGSAGTTTFNGAAGARLFGAITKSSMVITEYKA